MINLHSLSQLNLGLFLYEGLKVHLIKLLKLKTTPKFDMKFYLKWLFSGKLNLWTEYPKFG